MWYRLKYTDGTLSACVWPFPWCFEKTDDTQKAFAEFPFDADGLARAEAWVAAQYEADVPRWSACPAMPRPHRKKPPRRIRKLPLFRARRTRRSICS